MKPRIIILSFLLLASVAKAELGAKPDMVILPNHFDELEWVGEYVFALSELGLTVFKWDNDFPKLELVDYLPLPTPAKSMKYTTLGLVIRHVNNDLSFIETNFSTNMVLLGTVAPPVDYYDFAIESDDIYLSRWFDGIDKYHISGFSGLSLLGNNKSGIVITKLESSEDLLYGLDLYNGIVKYDLKDGFGNNVSKWLVDSRKTSFELSGDTVILSGNEAGILVGDFEGSSIDVLGVISGIKGIQRFRRSGQFAAFMSERKVNLVDLNTLQIVDSVNLESENWRGDVGTIDGLGRCLILPGLNGGIKFSRFHDLSNLIEVLDRPGPVKAVLIHDDFLFTGGGGNPLEAYEIKYDSLLPPKTIIGDSNGLTDLVIADDKLFALYPDEREISVIDISDPGDYSIIDELELSIEDAAKIKVFDSLQLVIGKNQIEWFHELLGNGVWTFDKPIVEVELIQNRLYLTDSFGKLSSHTILSNMSLSKCAELNLIGTGWAMNSFHDNLFVFTGTVLSVYSQCLELDTIVQLSRFVLDAEFSNDTLYTVGPDGIGKYELENGLPVLIEQSGTKGSRISAAGGAIATTDGSSINLYFGKTEKDEVTDEPAFPLSTKLFENYPNPFNAQTTISFEIDIASRVELRIYNMLGQKVRSLEDREYSAGRYSVSWNGKDDIGNDVAGGIYFYRLSAGAEVTTKKMLLLK